MATSPTPAIPAATAAPAAVAHVRARGLLTDRAVVRTGLRVLDRSRSHPVYLVEVGGTPLVYVKALAGGDAEQGSPEREVAAYELAARHPELAGLVPGWHGSDAAWLVLDAVAGVPLLDLVVAGGPPATAGCGALGCTLGRWHRHAAGAAAPDGTPWVLRLAAGERPAFADSNEGVRAFLADATARVDLDGLLARGAAAWTPATVVHGDLRLDNCLVRDGAGAVLLDWETAGTGDPAWDVAAVVQELVALPGLGDLGSAVRAAAGLLRAFCDAYDAELAVDPARTRPLVAARLLQRAVQVAAWDSRGRTDETDRLLGLALAADAARGTWWRTG